MLRTSRTSNFCENKLRNLFLSVVILAPVFNAQYLPTVNQFTPKNGAVIFFAGSTSDAECTSFNHTSKRLVILFERPKRAEGLLPLNLNLLC